MTQLRVGDRVRDVYTGRVGRVCSLDDLWNRCTVALTAAGGLGAYVMIGCQSWFEPVDD